jgi:hypothetical protein
MSLPPTVIAGLDSAVNVVPAILYACLAMEHYMTSHDIDEFFLQNERHNLQDQITRKYMAGAVIVE